MRSPRAALAGVVALLATAVPVLAAPAQAAAPLTGSSVTITVRMIDPTTPARTAAPQPLSVELDVHNASGRTLDGVTISAARGNPIFTEPELDAALAKPPVPGQSSELPLRSEPLVIDQLVPGATSEQVYRTTTGWDTSENPGLCMCTDAVYPLYFTATYGTEIVGHTQTFLPVFGKGAPKKLTVGWLWPLLDRPHRLTDDQTFTDDDLATEVSPGGRLDDALSTLERLHGSVPVTLIVDPDLIDELQVMATGYKVQGAGGKVTTGAHGAVAAQFLSRLRAVLTEPGIELVFTPFGDPDVEALQEHGLSWSSSLPTAEQNRISAALGGHTARTDIYWPDTATVGRTTLATLHAQGVSTVVLNDNALRGGRYSAQVLDALATIHGVDGSMTAGVVSTELERLVARALQPGSNGLGALPALASAVALRAIENTGTSHYVLLAPPRDLDTNPQVAARVLRDTADTSWSSPLPLGAATGSVRPVDHGPLHAVPAKRHISEATVNAIGFVDHTMPELLRIFRKNAGDAKTLLGSVPAAIQRTASNSLIGMPQLSDAAAEDLRQLLERVQNGVHLVRPTSGTYTLTSSNSSLPATIQNTLPVPVHVQVTLSAVNGLPGFSARPKTVTIRADGTQQIRIKAHVDRVGRIEVEGRLSSPDGALILGSDISLSVRSTALGTVGVVITSVAGAVLVIALLLRFVTQLRKRRKRRAKQAAARPATPVGTGA